MEGDGRLNVNRGYLWLCCHGRYKLLESGLRLGLLFTALPHLSGMPRPSSIYSVLRTSYFEIVLLMIFVWTQYAHKNAKYARKLKTQSGLPHVDEASVFLASAFSWKTLFIALLSYSVCPE